MRAYEVGYVAGIGKPRRELGARQNAGGATEERRKEERRKEGGRGGERGDADGVYGGGPARQRGTGGDGACRGGRRRARVPAAGPVRPRFAAICTPAGCDGLLRRSAVGEWGDWDCSTGGPRHAAPAKDGDDGPASDGDSEDTARERAAGFPWPCEAREGGTVSLQERPRTPRRAARRPGPEEPGRPQVSGAARERRGRSGRAPSESRAPACE